ncbi:MetQ/NlpA family ABC transporter substrate-binding protein [Leptolyngbya sp. FACHB-261]|uniref:MetQ/NlpA family ABC transporter substrate-binding protein n=1 Tax=Leptolyngbya sp. FACHB-261 TaxID=2692806 RepID=UPI0016874EF9|nr:MetQ/NlpA family ABC transporter substrate-binding protein [Leptolyngbya sp. FACHB-261]MBD2100047.1 MetQ/NlpA family ABC transporter substrate-binding protein [Leptolyngbya sp. FACHB-261]
MKRFVYALVAFLTFITVVVSGCGASQTAAPSGSTGAGQSLAIKVGASPVPHAEILNFVKDNLATQAGLDLQIVEFTDYVQPNLALKDAQIDANFFQHVPYMEDFGKERGIDMVAVTKVHIEPLGIYSRKVKSLTEVPEKGLTAIPNDATNAGRALLLLANNNLLQLKQGVGVAATVQDITGNSKDLEIKELEAAQLPRALDDVSIAVINGNYALESDLKPSQDALALESAKDNPYANVLAVLRGRENDPPVQTLAKLLNSPEVKQFIDDKYQGAVIPAF